MVSGILKGYSQKSALAELGSATGGLQTVLKLSFTQFSLIFRAFQRFRSPVILFITDKKW